MQEKNLHNANKILDRLHSAYQIKQNQELAEFLGVSPATLSTWRKRDSVDYDIVIKKCKGINLHWLLTGEGSMYAENEAGRALQAKAEGISNVSGPLTGVEEFLNMPVVRADDVEAMKRVLAAIEAKQEKQK